MLSVILPSGTLLSAILLNLILPSVFLQNAFPLNTTSQEHITTFLADLKMSADILACLLDLNFKQSKLTRLNF